MYDWKALTVDQRREYVSQRAAAGWTALQIANSLINCTRNSIIGFCHRNGVQLGPKHKTRNAKPVEVPQDANPSKADLKTRPLSPLRYVKAKRKPEKKRPEVEAPAAVEVPVADQSVEAAPELAAEPVAIEQRVEDPAPAVEAVDVSFVGKAWKELTPDQKVAAVKAGIADGCRPREIAEQYGATPKAVSRVAEKNGLRFGHATSRRGVNILDLGRHQCRGPLWEVLPAHIRRPVKDWMFCGKPVEGSSTYCQSCAAKYLSRPEKDEKAANSKR